MPEKLPMLTLKHKHTELTVRPTCVSKKASGQALSDNFVNSKPIFKTLSPLERKQKCQQHPILPR